MATEGRRTVFVDLSTLPPDGSSGGAARFVLRLLDGLLAGPSGLDVHLIIKPEATAAVGHLAKKGAVLRTLGSGADVKEPGRLRRALRRMPRPFSRLVPDSASLRRQGADALFSPLFTALFHEPGLPHLAVAYDFQELSHPGFFHPRERMRRRAFRADLGRADHVVAISHATRRDVVERVGIRPERVSVLPPVVGVPRMPCTPEEIEQCLAGHGLTAGGYALYPANYWPHKNHERLLTALARARQRQPEMRLVLCGALDTARRWLIALARNRGLSDSVRVFPYLSEDEVTALLQGARFLVFPSLYEGYGIPVLEAMALGTPVACSDLPALRELAEESACYFNPQDETSIAEALSLLWEREETRQRLSRDGRSRAECCARVDVVGAYRKLLES